MSYSKNILKTYQFHTPDMKLHALECYGHMVTMRRKVAWRAMEGVDCCCYSLDKRKCTNTLNTNVISYK